MKIANIILLLSVIFSLNIFSQDSNIAERLGYKKDSKLLIIHADDLGVAHSENSASLYALENSPVNSASIMVPCPWFPEIASYARKNKDMDFGLHLTLNSEWENYKWGPVSARESVKSLVNHKGYFFSSVDSLIASAKVDQIEIELRSQIKKALSEGINVTHLDTHMGSAASTPEIAAVYIRLGNEFKVPVLLDKRVFSEPMKLVKDLINENTVVVDEIHMAYPNSIEEGMASYYEKLLQNLSPGLNCLLIHTAYDDEEMRAITINHPEYGAAWRQEDFDFFTSEKCAEILKEQGIILVSWKELRDKITRAD
ncbi:polysaccharide deacetylase family protein [Eudoraea sp.]|uniref:polysaccharide deacetylase family protein n=2 Tax=Eudoraea sp. TaxID=1979955 RepID=UPI003C7584AB